ncbi:aldose 1-epimerase family protein [Salinarimonas ramus]|uniref:Aldose 1-epimerase n=1 Tax=Salinarimonas ramus TaxID=690164 RepID=A0A917V7T0_9HYPH|nr:aldose 1-epimerase family protein [Salinarimonas ramus]GGK47254.1 aldose 1-epimerase [Salinarimonas ramus]
MADDVFDLACGPVRARVAQRGGELVGLAFDGVPVLWPGDPSIWGRQAPVLFPVVGRSPGGRISVGGHDYPMPAHGFARDRDFTLIERDDRRVRLAIDADDETRAMYPFSFRLTIEVAAEEFELSIVAVIENVDEKPMPFGFGFHPGFVWPTQPAERSRYQVHFETAEDGRVRRADPVTGLLLPGHDTISLAGRTLRLDDGLFQAGSIHFERARSRSLWFGPHAGLGLRVAFPDSPQLGIWSLPGAPFLCIEPWQGLAAEAGGSGALEQRPGTSLLHPGHTARYRMTIMPGVRDRES